MITIDYDGFTISDAQGLTLYRHDWSDISAPTVGALTSAFGAAPALTPVEGDAHFAGGTAYEWDGLRLIDRDQAPERNAVSTMVIVSQSQIGSVVVTTQLGLGVGAAGADAAAVSNEIAPPRPDSGLGSVYCSRPTPDSMAICFDGDQADAIYRIRAPLTGL
jgi:hypothetical protein